MQLLPIRPPEFDILLSIPRCFVRMRTPTVRDYYGMIITNSRKETAEYLIGEYSEGNIPPLSEVTGAAFLRNYIDALQEYREKNVDIMQIPQTDFSEKKKDPFPIMTAGGSMVYAHSGIDIAAQQGLLITEYWIILADAVKARYSETEKGREYLEQAYNDMHHISTLEANIK